MSSKPRRGIRARHRRLRLEQLDSRLCLAVDAFLDGDVLNINGSDDADVILVRDDGRGTIHVQDGKSGERHEFDGVAEVVVDSLGGDDVVRFTRSGGNAPLPELDITAGEGHDDVAIGLLLPAVQKVRDAAARMSIDLGEGNDRLKINTNGFNDVELDVTAGGGDDNVLIGLLLPAVQKVRQAAATLDLGEGNDRLQLNTHGFDQVDLGLTAGGGDDNALIGLLLPAVQKVREAAATATMTLDLGEGNDRLRLNTHGLDQVDLGLTSGGGDDNVLIGLLLPAVQKVRDAAARVNLDLGDGNNLLVVNTTGIPHVDLDVVAGAGDDNVLIGLLLPAVQKVSDSAASVGLDLGAGNNVSNVRIRGFAIVDRTQIR